MSELTMRYVTQSELIVWRRCRRKWWLSNFRRLGLKPEYSKVSAAYLGTMVHDALEAYYRGNDPWAPFEEHLTQIDIASGEDEDRRAKFMKHYDMARIMVEGYFEWLEEEGADAGWEILAAEQKIDVPFAQHGEKILHIRGKMDLRVRDASIGDQPVFVDHKTVPNLTDIPSRADRDEQFLFYEILHRAATGETTGGGVFNMLRKVKRTARANPPFYGRHVVRFNERQLEVMKTRIKTLIHEMLVAEDLLANGVDHQVVVPPTPTASCNWECDFSHICSMFDDTSRVEDYIDDWYLELDPLARYAEIEDNTNE